MTELSSKISDKVDSVIDKKYFVYILSLRGGKYYIGKTTNAPNRLAEHIKKLGSEWTKKYKPIKIVKLYRSCDSFDEDKYTIMYMAMLGIENVRGGSFCKMVLSHTEQVIIEKMIASASDRCFKCGSVEHFVRDCTVNLDPNNKLDKLIEWCTEMANDDMIFVLIDESSNRLFEFENGKHDVSDIPKAKEKFVSKISKKYRATLFNLSVSSFDFCVKMLETDNPPYHSLLKLDGIAIMCRDSENLTNSKRKEFEKTIKNIMD